MSAGKSEVARWEPHCDDRLIRDDEDGSYVLHSDYAALARAENQKWREEVTLLTHKVITCGVAASHPDALLSTTGAYGTKWDSPQAQQVRELRQRAERAEALAGEYERDARRYRIWRDRGNPLTDALRIEAADLYGDDLDTAIDAVGGAR